MTKIVALSSFPHEFDYERLQYGHREDIAFSISGAKAPEDVIQVIRDADVVLFTDVTFDCHNPGQS